MLPKSRKPQILRLHQLQQLQRNRYMSQFSTITQQWLPQKLWSSIPILADIYYTYTTICKCRRRLGQQYTYVAMYNHKHYQQQGVLVNANTRTLMFVLQIILRHFIKYLFKKLWIKMEQKMDNSGGKWKILRDFVSMGVEGFYQQGKLFMLMLFLLGWNKYYNVIDTVLKNEYVYTFMNKDNTKVDYKIQGYMLLIVFVVKIIRFCVQSYKIINQKKKIGRNNNQAKTTQQDNHKNNNNQQNINQEQEQEQLCRICYDQIKNKSVTICGHIFCWDCILKYLATRPQCPVCRAACQSKQIIQLQNY